MLPRRTVPWLVAFPAFITLLAFVLRVRNLAAQSFWWDEAYSAVVARGSLAEIVAAITTADFHPPLHYVLFHYWRLVAGESEYALRFSAAAAGTATVALAFATGRRLFGALGGVVAAVLFALAPYLVYYSTEARMFALAALLALLALYLGHRAVGAPRWWPVFGLALALGLWNYYYAIWVVLPVGLFALASLRARTVLGFVVGLAVAAVLYAPWLPTWLARTIDWTSPWTGPTTPVRVLTWTWPALLTGIPAFELWREQLPRLGLTAAAALAAALTAVALLLRVPPRYRVALLYAAAAGALPLLAMAAVALYRPIYHPRYAIPDAPGLYLLFAGGIALPSRWLLPLRAALAVAVLGLFGYGLYRFEYSAGLERDDYRSAVSYVNQHQQPGDVTITNAPPGFDYYYRGSMPHREFPTGRYELDPIVRELNDLARGHSRLWYVTHDLRPSDPEGFVDGQLNSRARLLDERRYGQLRVALYALPDPPAFAPPAFYPLPGLAVGGALTLTGYRLDPTPTVSAGQVQLTLAWRVDRPVGADLGVYARLKDADGFAWGRQDRQPRDADFRLSSGWKPGATVTTHHAVPVDPGTPPGRYQLDVGVYRLSDVGALDVFAPDGTKLGPSLVLGETEIVRNPAPKLAGDLAAPSTSGDEPVKVLKAEVGQKEAAAGSSVELTAWFLATRPPGPRELVLRLLDASGRAVAERREPTGNGRYPAERWVAGDLVRTQARLPLPPTLGSGEYHVWMGLAAPGADPRGAPVAPLAVTAVPRVTALPALAHAVDASFGDDVRLRGWEVARPDAGRVRVTLQWAPTGTPSKEYRVFNHLVDPAEKIVAQRDGVPVNWARPTTSWVAGELIDDVYEVELPPGTTASGLKLRVGVYEPTGGARLRLPTGDDHLDLGHVP